MRGSADTTGMRDVGRRRIFFRFEIACQDQPLEMKLESTPSFLIQKCVQLAAIFRHDIRALFSLAFLNSSSVAAFRGPNSDRRNGACFATSWHAREIIAPEAPHSHAAFPNIRRDSSSDGERCMKDTDHPIRHLLRHPRISGRVRSRRSCAWHDDQFGRRQNTGLGWSDPPFAHVSVPKVIRGVAPAQLRGDRAECFVSAGLVGIAFRHFQQGATVMNNGDEKHTELLTVQETAKLLKVPVSWVYGHTRKRSIDPLPGYRLGKYWRFREDEVLAWVYVSERVARRLDMRTTLKSDEEQAGRAIEIPRKGETMARRGFQQGSLFQRGTRRKLWVARWWEDVIQADGTLGRLRRSEVIGTVAEFPTRRLACRFCLRG